ncbi:MAG: phosphatase PAP2 family protein [Chlamydiales bacterium]|nr:phosphatase PAP2 family protein [Chlamydiales bacterium]
MNTSSSSWKIKQLLLWHLLVGLMVGSFLLPATAVYWKHLDVGFFKFINGSLRGNSSWQTFWALANHKLADWVEDLFILGFYTVYIRKAHKELRLKKASELVFCLFYIAAILYFVNRLLFRKTWQIPRESPTLVVEGSVRLSDHISWLHIKDDSTKSFPGDHATTALLFAASYVYLARWRLGLFAAFYAAFLCMPRLITGAHWLSDVIIGAGSITIIFMSWAFCTPLARSVSSKIESFLRLFSIRKKKEGDQKKSSQA